MIAAIKPELDSDRFEYAVPAITALQARPIIHSTDFPPPLLGPLYLNLGSYQIMYAYSFGHSVGKRFISSHEIQQKGALITLDYGL